MSIFKYLLSDQGGNKKTGFATPLHTTKPDPF